ncbi:MAG: DUF1800 family protein [Betaproteobacteria bacterium]|nr:MAG: DUF1800 family protein [Betaproteobacteria bacterium]
MRLRIFLASTALVCSGLASFVAAAQTIADCPVNVTQNVQNTPFEATEDALILHRYAKGLRGAALVAGTRILAANAITVETYITSNLVRLDINGNGLLDLDDVAFLSRVTFGFSSPSWPSITSGASGSDYATRIRPEAQIAHATGGCNVFTQATPTAADVDAAKFLIRTTFGPTRTEIARFVTTQALDTSAGGSTLKQKASQWINDQTNAALTPRPQSHFNYIAARKAALPSGEGIDSKHMRESFWNQAILNKDQLRQRMAFALSQVLVVSSNGGSGDARELAGYYDMLTDNAFGNYRDILRKVALSPAMGRYLSHLRNDGSSANPNENFAREILQLFSVGLFMLDADGEKTLSSGQPISSYDESTVKGFAKVFTGFTFDDPYCRTDTAGLVAGSELPAADYRVARSPCTDKNYDTHPSWNWSPDRSDIDSATQTFPPVDGGWVRPMVAYPGYHHVGSKQLLKYGSYAGPVASCTNAIALASASVDPGLLPAFTSTEIAASGVASRTKSNKAMAYATLDKAIDNIFCHPNVGPFVAKHLIKFFVTSNPTRGYVGRVAAAFNNTDGVRGDMKATIRAVLLDDEALSPTTTLTSNELAKFGKLKEPILRLSALLRGFDAANSRNRFEFHYGLDDVDSGISQSPLQSPTVFNYYHPEYSPPGVIAAASAIGPEFEITTTTAIASTQNYFARIVTGNSSNNVYRQGGRISVGEGCNDSTGILNCILSNFADLYALQADSAKLFEYLNLVLLGGTMSQQNLSVLATALDNPAPGMGFPLTTLAANPTSTQVRDWQDRKRNRVKVALWLVVHSPEFQIQR